MKLYLSNVVVIFSLACGVVAVPSDQLTVSEGQQIPTDNLAVLDSGGVSVGIDRRKGGAISWLSWSDYPRNAVNHHDPGRLIQQSYYAGKSLDRTAEGQSKSWSPWTWNPIQGGGVGSWARVTELKRLNGPGLYSETIPKLWDMPDEEAQALMRQWTTFEPGMRDVVAVRCEFVSQRELDNRWGAAVPHHQELPACYFTRNFDVVKSYLGKGRWREEVQPEGPPWGKALPPRNAMAVFNSQRQGIAVFSPATSQQWNFGPHGSGSSEDPTAGPCMHVAPIDRASLGPKSVYSYRYWLAVGTEAQLAMRLDSLWQKYSGDRAEVKK